MWRMMVAALVMTAVARADNWPRFFGENGSGIATGQKLPSPIDAKEHVRWKVPTPGAGNGSPVLWGERLYLQTAGTAGSGRAMVCMSSTTGKVIWETKLSGDKAPTHAKNSLASSTPAVDGTRVVGVFWDGKAMELASFDLDGKLQWKTPLGPHKSQHGCGHSPVLHGGKVFVNNDQDDSAVLLAFDAETGKKAWEQPRRAFRACYSTPLLRPGKAGTELVVISTAGPAAYEPASGKLLWEHNWKFTANPLRTVASPVLAGDLVLASSGDGKGDRHLVAVRPAQGSSAELAWENTKAFPYVPTLIFDKGRLLGVTDKGLLLVHDAASGRELASRRLGAGFSASPLLVDGVLITVDEKGSLSCVGTGEGFPLLGKTELGEAVIATPAVGNGGLFVRTAGHVICLGRKDKS
ncbi:MAG: PQQ-binding-like beta-propeller repeat protein [Planctomycetes bacterium]|jgi:outer membrane protein assembly factor BamB|nr:PQQ-binding-like beta-propeller repeat protein [Planctomycetota bacterium]